jgi:outer membrane receptor protein involved in Fe transport
VDGRLKPVKRVPQWVDVIDRTELEEWRPLDIGELARRLPNVVVGDGGNPFLALPVIRGFGGERVRILTDGVWPSTQTLGLFGGTLSLWDPESTERVEIYHGPGAYLKGIDSPGGLINIVPRRPRRHGALTANFGGASSYRSATNTFRQRGEVDVGSGPVAALIGFTWTDVGHRETADDELRPTDYQTYAADIALDYFLDNKSALGLTFQHMQADDTASPFATGSSLADPTYERTFFGLTITSFDVGPVFHGHRASISLDRFFKEDDREFVSDPTTGIGSESETERFDAHIEGSLDLFPCHTTWAELTLSYAHVDRIERLLCTQGEFETDPVPLPGAAVIHDPSTHAELGACNSVSRAYEAEEILLSALIEDQVHDECWDKHVGLRVDLAHVEDTRNGRDETEVLVGAAAGVARHFNPRLTGFANASVGWRRPSIDERTATLVVGGNLLVGNADLDPELHANVEVGVKSAFKDRASLQAAVFGHYTDDYIAARPVFGALPGEMQLVNRGDAFLFGFEASGAWRPCTTIEGWELYATLGTTRTTDEDLIADFPLLYRAGTRYSVPAPRGYRVRRWFADLSLHGATDSTDGPRGGDAYLTGDVLFGTSLDFGCYRAGHVTLGLTNLLDDQYTPPGAILPAAGLSIVASLAIEW